MDDRNAGSFEKTNAGTVALRLGSGILTTVLAGLFPGLLVGSIAAGFADPWRGADERLYWSIGVCFVACLGARVAWLGAARSFPATVALWGVSSMVAVFTSAPTVYLHFYGDNPRSLIWVLGSVAVTANLANAFVWILNRGFRLPAPSTTQDGTSEGIHPIKTVLRVVIGVVAAAVATVGGMIVFGASLEFLADPYTEFGQLVILLGGVLGAALGARIAWIGATNSLAASAALQLYSSLTTGLVVLPLEIATGAVIEENFGVFWLLMSVAANVVPAARWILPRRRRPE